ncbi:general secretion pathway protein, partial [Sulfitobacter sp. CW3]|nr:general secretion pathway protein [Sulfitobacter sp. CW3]
WAALNPVGTVGETIVNSGTAAAASVPANLPNVLTNSLPFPINTNTPSGNQIQASVRAGGLSLQATLKAFEQAGVSRILAEPTLTAISGEAAKFLAGGEFAVPSSATCAVNGACTPGITYKPYGVALS